MIRAGRNAARTGGTTMRRVRWLRRLGAPALVGIALLWAGACAPAAPASAPAAAPPPAGPQPAGGPSDWDTVVAAARQEGKLVISAPTGQLWREALQSFEQDYPGISLELTGGNSRDFWPRLFQERDAGQYLWDLRVGGPDPEVFDARDSGALDSVRPLLALPEVTDES